MNELREDSSPDYDDAYSTCERTYATLCIYLPDVIDLIEFSDQMAVSPSRIQTKGEIREGRVSRWPTAWFLEIDKVVESKDVRRHVDWLIEKLTGKEEIIRQVLANHGRVEISCYWLSSHGHGGPMLSPNTMGKLSKLGIGIWFDVYFSGADGA